MNALTSGIREPGRYIGWFLLMLLLLLWPLLVTRTRLPRARRETLVWIGVAVGVGVVLALIAGMGGSLTGQVRGSTQISLLGYLR